MTTLLPSLQQLDVNTGCFRINANTRIRVKGDDSAFWHGLYLAEIIRSVRPKWSIPCINDTAVQDGDIVLSLTASFREAGDEGYRLVVSGQNITLEALRPAGLFYGIQTLYQLMLDAADGAISLNAMTAIDKPALSWRGLMLDCVRHFMSVEFVKRYIDVLAFHKMNRFHWHLTDDQGWRVEIKRYPKLTDIGAFRGQRHYGGFYTQNEIRDVVAYAKERHITVIPEIDLPGHCQAALAAYPHLGCTGEPMEVSERVHVIHDKAFCVGKEATFTFLADVLGEVADLFEAPYVHIGADECLKDQWRQCPDCQALKKQKGFDTEEQLQAHFVKRAAEILAAKGKTTIGWEEITEGSEDTAITIQVWKGGLDLAVSLAEKGYDVILSPTSHCYFDYKLDRINLEKTASLSPLPQSLSSSAQGRILGGEACMWTEDTPESLVDSKVFPRLTALAEVLWTGRAVGDFEAFTRRMTQHDKRLDHLGVTCGPAV